MGAVLVGGGLSFAHDFQWITARIDVLAEGAKVHRSLGDVGVELLDAAALALAKVRTGSFAFGVGPGWRFGAGLMHGTATSARATGESVAGFFSGPFGAATASIVWRSLSIDLELDAGYATSGVRGLADTDSAVSLDGGFVGGSLALGFVF